MTVTQLFKGTALAAIAAGLSFTVLPAEASAQRMSAEERAERVLVWNH